MPAAQQLLAQAGSGVPLQDLPGAGAALGHIVHVVGRATTRVFSFLGPASASLARCGVAQAVVMIDGPRSGRHTSRLHESVELILVPFVRNPIGQLLALLDSCRSALAARAVQAVHLHGLLPEFVALGVARAAGVQVPIYYSPHGSAPTALLRNVGALARWLRLAPPRSEAIVNLSHDTLAFDRHRRKSVQLVETPVAEAFFAAARREAQGPLIVTGGDGQSTRSVEQAAQLAVLLGGGELGLRFDWLGSAPSTSRRCLDAAHVEVSEIGGDEQCAARLSTAWVYFAPANSRGFTSWLPEAMAAGVPCVAMDCPAHRELIRDGETGFLCSLESDMIRRIAGLVDSRALRASIGQAAHAEAQRRLGGDRFSRRLMSAYALANRDLP